MRRLLILVEGQTEETFVRDILGPHLKSFSIFPIPVLLKTKRVKAGGHFRGGVTSSQQVFGDILRLLRDTNAIAVTTIIDYYGLPTGFPGLNSRPVGTPMKRISHVENAMASKVQNRRFIPHLVLHEYEAWLYCDPSATAGWVFDNFSLPSRLAEIAISCGGAEFVDEGPDTAPSKRLLKLFPSYRKTLHGPMAAGAIGLLAIRKACPHMNGWLSRLESL